MDAISVIINSISALIVAILLWFLLLTYLRGSHMIKNGFEDNGKLQRIRLCSLIAFTIVLLFDILEILDILLEWNNSTGFLVIMAILPMIQVPFALIALYQAVVNYFHNLLNITNHRSWLIIINTIMKISMIGLCILYFIGDMSSTISSLANYNVYVFIILWFYLMTCCIIISIVLWKIRQHVQKSALLMKETLDAIVLEKQFKCVKRINKLLVFLTLLIIFWGFLGSMQIVEINATNSNDNSGTNILELLLVQITYILIVAAFLYVCWIGKKKYEKFINKHFNPSKLSQSR